MDWMPQAVRDGVIVILVISGPIVFIAAAIGLLVGILQAATQVQEQTIGSALKILGVFALIIVSGYWMFGYLNQYTERTISSAFTFVPSQTKKVISKRASIYNDSMEVNYPQLPKLNMGNPIESNEYDFARGPGGSNVLGAPQQNIIPEREITATMSRNLADEEEEFNGEEFDEGYQELLPLE